MYIPTGANFEGASIININQRSGCVDFFLQGYRDSESPMNVLLTIVSVAEIKIDGKLSEYISMEAEDGEVIHLEIHDNSLNIIIEWVNYSASEETVFFTKEYQLTGNDIKVEIT